jgi:hypothetical protein
MIKNLMLPDLSQLSMPFEKKRQGLGATIAPGSFGRRAVSLQLFSMILLKNLPTSRLVILSAAKNLAFPGSC